MPNEKIYKMRFGKVFECLIAKAERKGRTKEEVYEVTSWLSGYSTEQIDTLAGSEATVEDFYANFPRLHPNADLIRGSICGVRVEEIEDPTMKRVRQLDKLVDELAKGKEMDKILRK